MDILEKMLLSAPRNDGMKGAACLPPSNDEAFTFYPNVYRLLTERKIGKVDRDLSKISIKLTDQGWSITLTEPATGQILFHVHNELFRLIQSLEARLVSDKPGWVPDKYAPKPKKKK